MVQPGAWVEMWYWACRVAATRSECRCVGYVPRVVHTDGVRCMAGRGLTGGCGLWCVSLHSGHGAGVAGEELCTRRVRVELCTRRVWVNWERGVVQRRLGSVMLGLRSG